MEGRRRKEGRRRSEKKAIWFFRNLPYMKKYWDKNKITVPCFLMEKTVYPQNRDWKYDDSKRNSLFLKDPPDIMDIWNITVWGQQFYASYTDLHFVAYSSLQQLVKGFHVFLLNWMWKLNTSEEKFPGRWTLSKKVLM